MTIRTDPAVAAFLKWKRQSGQSIRQVGESIGDRRGGQLQQWSSGTRPNLPFPLKVRLARYTGIPLQRLLSTESEQELLRDLQHAMRRGKVA